MGRGGQGPNHAGLTC